MGKRILIVDDDADFCTSLTAVLEGAGYSVSIARNGREGIEKARSEKPDLIVLDIMMEHDWAGYEVNQAIKYGAAEGGDAPHILMVSSIPVDPATRFIHATEAGMVTPDAYLTKPVNIEEFLQQVRSLLEGPAT